MRYPLIMGNRGVCNHLLLVGFLLYLFLISKMLDILFLSYSWNAWHPLLLLFLRWELKESRDSFCCGISKWTSWQKLSWSSHNLGVALSTLTGGYVVFVLQGTEAVENEEIPVMTLLAEDVFTQERIKQSCVWFCKHGFYSWLIKQ